MIKYLKMKRVERKVKLMFYELLAEVIDNQKEILDFGKKMYAALKDASSEELYEEFVSKMAEIIHNENRSKIE